MCFNQLEGIHPSIDFDNEKYSSLFRTLKKLQKMYTVLLRYVYLREETYVDVCILHTPRHSQV